MTYGCIGQRLPHSFSKEIHEKLGPEKYSLIELEPEEVGAFLTKKDFKAINVTIPYKQTVIPYLDFISETAHEIGAVNTVVNHGGKLFGFNTDFAGMTALLKRNSEDITGKKALVLGTGGTAKTAVFTLKKTGAGEVLRVSRNPSGADMISYEEAVSLHSDARIIVNTTPVGMYPNVFPSPVDLSAFKKLETVVDAVYNPLRTTLVQQASALGARAEGGLYMLVAQAVKAYEFFHMTTLPEGETDRVFKEISAEKENIVLIGMPGCGKTAIAKRLAKFTGREVFDTDSLIVEKAGKSIPEIFADEGEEAFRDLETEVIQSLSKYSGVIISTGGGAILREQNVDALKKNGKLYFRDRPLECIRPTKTRPLSSDPEALKKRYEERYPRYMEVADEVIDTGDDLYAAVKETQRRHFA